MHLGGFVVIARNYTAAYRYVIYLPDRYCVWNFVMPERLGPVRGVAQHEQAIWMGARLIMNGAQPKGVHLLCDAET